MAANVGAGAGVLPMDQDQRREYFPDAADIRIMERGAAALEAEAFNQRNLVDVPVRGTDLEELGIVEYPIPRLQINACGQWELESNPKIVAGTTGYYQPFTLVEAALYQAFKTAVYKRQIDKKVPYSSCHTPGPKCVIGAQKWKTIAPCSMRRSSYRLKKYRKTSAKRYRRRI
jgi:hypothetical protein